MINKQLLFYIFLIPLFLFSNCGGTSEAEVEDEEEVVEQEEITLKSTPKINADSAFVFVKAQTDFGPRVPNSEAHQKCGDYLIEKMKSFGFETTAQKFDAIAYDSTVLKSRNIIASFNPEAKKRILLAAHWDARPYNDKGVEKTEDFTPIDGANDGASGVGVLMEVARVINESKNKPKIGVDIIFFDSEDYGYPENYEGNRKPDSWCLGSQHWAKNKHKADYSAYYGILLDMVGAKDAHFYKEGSSRQYAPKINDRVWQIAHQLGFKKYFIDKNSPGITDDHVYVNKIANIPMIDIVDFDPKNPASFFPKYHHTHDDNIDLINKKTLAAVGQVVLQVIYNEE